MLWTAITLLSLGPICCVTTSSDWMKGKKQYNKEGASRERVCEHCMTHVCQVFRRMNSSGKVKERTVR